MSSALAEPGAIAVEAPGVLNAADVQPLRQTAVRGALATAMAQGAGLVLRTGSMIVLARLLVPRDFGLIGMVTAVTGFMAFFHDFGLSMASIQRVTVTRDQISTLFWVNLGAGTCLAAGCVLLAPALVWFYGEPRLLLIAITLGGGFLCNGAAVQHRAILQRGMRFGTIALIDTVSLVAGVIAGVSVALISRNYWALVATSIVPPVVAAIATWLSTGWVPGPPRRGSGVRSMLMFGGTVTLNTFVVYIAYNFDKVLLGRFWGAEVLGVYGRAYQLVNLPTENLNSAISQVALPALSRVQNDPERLRNYFLKGYALFLATVVPVTLACAMFAEDIVGVLLGGKWLATAGLFRLLAPTIVVYALINPCSWLMMATGRTTRSLKIALMIAPAVMLGYLAGLHEGSRGVAIGFSTAMVLLAGPVIAWSKHGTLITAKDIFQKIVPPLVSAVGSALVVFAAGRLVSVETPFVRLVAEMSVLFGTYAVILLFVMRQKVVYMQILRDIKFWRSERGR